MGNCQAAEAAAVMIQHPGNHKTDMIYWSVSAQEIMSSNPGHYVGLVMINSGRNSTCNTQNGTHITHLKLLRPDDTLLIGHVYRLIPFQDVLKEFATKKCVKLGKLLKEGGALSNPNANSKSQNFIKEEAGHRPKSSDVGSSSGRRGGGGHRGMGRNYGGGGGHWKPALHCIAEVGIN